MGLVASRGALTASWNTERQERGPVEGFLNKFLKKVGHKPRLPPLLLPPRRAAAFGSKPVKHPSAPQTVGKTRRNISQKKEFPSSTLPLQGGRGGPSPQRPRGSMKSIGSLST